MRYLARLVRWLRPLSAEEKIGRRGERLAVRHLKRQGCQIVAHSNRSRLGEIDIVAVDGRTVVFVEVKTRRTSDAGHPAEAVDAAKQSRLTQSALGFLKRHGLCECSARFDVVAITWGDGRSEPRIEHVRNAFDARGQGQMFR